MTVGFSDRVFTTVADILLDEGNDDRERLLHNFNDFVAALSMDSGLPEEEVQSRLVEKMLYDPRHRSLDENVIWLDEVMKLRGRA